MSLKTDLYGLIDPLLTDTLIWLDQNAPRPALPYVGMKITPYRAINYDNYGDPDANGIAKITGQREFTLSIQRYGNDSVTVLQDLMNNMRKITTQDAFVVKGIAIADTAMPVTDISIALDGVKFEPRAAVDFRFRIRSEILDDVGLIETVNVQGKTDNFGDIDLINQIIPIN